MAHHDHTALFFFGICLIIFLKLPEHFDPVTYPPNDLPDLLQNPRFRRPEPLLYRFRLPINPAVTVFGLVPEFAISGLKADQTLIVKVK